MVELRAVDIDIEDLELCSLVNLLLIWFRFSQNTYNLYFLQGCLWKQCIKFQSNISYLQVCIAGSEPIKFPETSTRFALFRFKVDQMKTEL